MNAAERQDQDLLAEGPIAGEKTSAPQRKGFIMTARIKGAMVRQKPKPERQATGSLLER